MSRFMNRAVLHSILALALLGAVGATSAQAASANGGIYAVTPSWWGNCTNFGGVAGLATVNSYVGHSNPGDFGDDIAWVPVRLNTWQSIQIKVACKRFGWAVGSSISATILPTRNGQAFYFGADSNYWSN
jgi:hypothetical protein